MGRSSAYWATNLYPDPRQAPKPAAPHKDLPTGPAARFRRVRDGLLELDGVVEHVKFMGPTWRWTWEFTVGHRKLCWLHVTQNGVSVTFTVTTHEESRALKLPKLSSALVGAMRAGQRTGPVTWCWLEMGDLKTADAMLGFARRKLQWFIEDAPSPAAARRSLAV